jgi:diguanylate cyclase (GGDEF)-like protein/PAS domain S-box-containing protein
VSAALKTRQRLGERDRTALIALAGVLLSLGVWGLWAWVSAILNNQQVVESLFNPSHSDAVLRLSSIVVVMLGTLLAQSGYSQWFRAVERLRIEQNRIEQLYANSPDAHFALSPSLNVEFANPAGVTLAGNPVETVVGMPCHEAVWKSNEPCDGCPAAAVIANGKRAERTFLDTSTGAERWLDHLVYPVLGTDGSMESLVEVYRDVTSLRVAEEALIIANSELEDRVAERTRELAETNTALQAEALRRERTAAALVESEERYRALVDDSPDMVLVHKDGEIVYLNPPGALLLGLADVSEAAGWPVRRIWEVGSTEFSEADIEAALMSGVSRRPVAALLARPDGGFIDVEMSVARLEYGGERAVQCVVRDITERIHAQRTIERMAFYDSLTDLPNRALFNERLTTALAQARRREELVAVVFVDLDDFKTINDTVGHVVGDGVLVAVANRLRALLRDEDTIARQSGDEFTIIARVANREDAATIASRVLESLRDSVNVDGFELHVSASVGVSVYPVDGLDESELVRNADTAMYRAKELGRNVYRLYTPDMSESAFDRLELEAALRVAVEQHQFVLYYQPQVDASTGRIVGVEALVRWQHPTQGILPPRAFIHLAEQAGFMGELGLWILRTACTKAARWNSSGHAFGRICVNLSAREFVQQDVVANVKQVLEETMLDPDMLELEITESVAMHNIEHVFTTLGALREIGVRVAIDDFGTGYSSMSYLKRFPINTLKIAQDFMRDVHVNVQSAAIAGMVIDLCRELELDVVAEGVEFVEQLDFLQGRGCNVIQGFLFSPPVPEDALIEFLARGAATPIADQV